MKLIVILLFTLNSAHASEFKAYIEGQKDERVLRSSGALKWIKNAMRANYAGAPADTRPFYLGCSILIDAYEKTHDEKYLQVAWDEDCGC